jgi:hypothetical protein
MRYFLKDPEQVLLPQSQAPCVTVPANWMSSIQLHKASRFDQTWGCLLSKNDRCNGESVWTWNSVAIFSDVWNRKVQSIKCWKVGTDKLGINASVEVIEDVEKRNASADNQDNGADEADNVIRTNTTDDASTSEYDQSKCSSSSKDCGAAVSFERGGRQRPLWLTHCIDNDLHKSGFWRVILGVGTQGPRRYFDTEAKGHMPHCCEVSLPLAWPSVRLALTIAFQVQGGPICQVTQAQQRRQDMGLRALFVSIGGRTNLS